MAKEARSVGFGVESTWGTYATATIWPSTVTSVDIDDPAPAPIPYGGIISGQFTDAEQGFVFGPRVGGGVTINQSLGNRDADKILEHIFGSRTVTGSSPTITATITQGTQYNLGMSIQVARPYGTGSSQLVSTLLGCKATAATFNLQKGGVWTLSSTWAAKNVDDSKGLTAPVYTATEPLPWHNTTACSWAGTTLKPQSITIQVTNPLNTERNSISSGGVLDEHDQNGLRTVIVSLAGLEFDSLTAYNALVATTAASRIGALTITTTSVTNTSQLFTFAATKAMIEGDMPGGLDRDNLFIEQPLRLRCLVPNGSTSSCTVTYVHPT